MTAPVPKQLTKAPLEPGSSDALRQAFGKNGFLIRHRLQQDSLFDLDRLEQLAVSLPPHRIEYNLGDLPLEQEQGKTPENGLSISETIRRIGSCDSWMVLKHVQQDAAYKALLDSCLDQLEQQLPAQHKPFYNRAAFIFISSPHAVTPLHIDPENNFLLQIRGEKKLSMFGADNSVLLPEETLENFYTRGDRNIVFGDSEEEHATHFDLAAGEGVHVPQNAPHYVKNGSEVSVSFSITFQNPSSDRRQGQYWINNRLRAVGLKPKPPATSGFSAQSKYLAYRTLRAVKRTAMTTRNG